jgi:aryl-alcohol dehydrogenase-like predicted oxidoreductase
MLLAPFSLYQGRWNAAFRDMESEIIPTCEEQGIAIISWTSLGGGQLVAAEKRKEMKEDPNAGKGFYSASEDDMKMCDVLEQITKAKNATLQDTGIVGIATGLV